ncbi:MAG: rhodanese-like domain-containing protein [Myxococcales bacterium]|nr:rhodanese-like domain-containing protein [Myxococcales bacterium]
MISGLLVAGVGALVFGFVVRSMNRGPDVSDLVEEELLKGAVVVDVRSAAEFASGHVAGALNIPVDQIAARMGELPADKTVIVYCRSGARSAAAARTLTSAGRKVVDARTAGSFPNR